MNDCLITYIEKDIFKTISNKKKKKNYAVISRYEDSSRTIKLALVVTKQIVSYIYMF
jgi:hypothetical protein